MSSGVSDEELNAFVDGALSAASAARVAAVIATDPNAAKRVACLHQMKAALAGMADDLELPDLPRPGPRRLAWRIAVGLSTAAAILIVLFWPAPATDPSRQAADVPLVAHHDHWAARPTASPRIAWPREFDWLENVMLASGLQLVQRTGTADIEHLGFEGPNGCRVSLFLSDKRGPDDPLRLTLTRHMQHAQGQAGAVAFEMIARDMAPARFATLATQLHRNTPDRSPESALTVAVLQATRLPCTT